MERIRIVLKILAILTLLLILSPILLILGILFAVYSIWTEITREYRCKGCDAWIPKKERDKGKEYCTKRCYYDG